MKKILITKIIVTIMLFLNLSNYAQMYFLSTSAQLIVSPVQTDNLLMHIAVDSQSYTQGGLTFYYPQLYFLGTPVISITLQSVDGNFSNTSGNIISAWVTNNSATSTTVVVVQNNEMGGFDEVQTGSVVVHLVATAPGEIDQTNL